jgi:simple sugar transport system ATP-binding protein
LVGNRLMKRYGSTVALDAVDISFYPGEIHAILGENGAGKSTLVGVLSGNIAPDEGDLKEGDLILHFRSARDARRHGIDIVQQHFMLVPAFTVAENLALASLQTKPLLNAKAVSEEARSIAERLGWSVDLDAVTADLSVGSMQRVEIIKALADGGKVVLFDEPTATLSPEEVQDLFGVMRKLRDDGRAIALITHKLDEALAIADRVSVLRKGKVVVTTPAKGIAPEQLAKWMVGELPPNLAKNDVAAGDRVVTVSRMSVFGDRRETLVDDVSFEIAAGEIVGFGGVAGNGQVPLAEALVGIRKYVGACEIVGEVAYIPEDRQRDGLALSMSIADNLLIEGHRKKSLSVIGLFIPPRVRAWCETIIAKYAVHTPSIDIPASSLSGGNQQKVVVGRSLDCEPKAVVAVNPTRGLDVRAENFVHSQLLEAKSRGAAIALFSTDLDELADLADRIFYMNSGRLTSELLETGR